MSPAVTSLGDESIGPVHRFVSRAGRRARPRAASHSLLASLPLHAQSALDALRQRDQELEAIRAEQKKAAETQAKLKDEIDAIGEDRRKLNQALIDGAARLRDTEDRIAETEGRLKPLDDSERSLRKSLEGRRATIAEVLAALQRIGRHPPPAIMVRPEDALQSVRTAIMLGAVVPEMRVQGRGAGLRPRRPAAHPQGDRRREGPAGARRRRADRGPPANRPAESRSGRKSRPRPKGCWRPSGGKSLALARQVDNLKDLIGKVEQGLDSASRAARAAERAAEGRESRIDLAALNDPGRLTPAIAFASARGRLPLPVNGAQNQGIRSSRQPRRHRKGPFHRHPARCPGHGTL